jgi:heme-degrading monooxygenase HmoA
MAATLMQSSDAATDAGHRTEQLRAQTNRMLSCLSSRRRLSPPTTQMVELAQGYEGYLGIEPARNPDGSGVAVVYWKDHESILAFARDPEHMIVKKKGREIWYSHYMIRICKVEREYGRPDE